MPSIASNRINWRLPLFIAFFIGMLLLFGDDSPYRIETVTFDHGETQLTGSLVLPEDNKRNHPCFVFVHGAQDMPRDGYGYYKTYWREFAKAGFCSLSWDKPGVGDSTGDWHHQSMIDRAKEALAAIEYLKDRSEVNANEIGLIGLSQAGWVLPLAASMSDEVKFIIPISGAVDWISQGNHFEKNALEEKGLSRQQIAEALSFRSKVDALLKERASYQDYLALLEREEPPSFGPPTSRSNWRFYQLNIDTDVKNSLVNVRCPILAIFGDKDIYVDVKESMCVYESELAAGCNTDYRIVLFEDADHSLMKSHTKRFTHRGMSLYWSIFRWEILGKHAFPDGYFEMIVEWTKKHFDSE